MEDIIIHPQPDLGMCRVAFANISTQSPQSHLCDLFRQLLDK